MRNKLEIVDEYKNLLKIKKMVIILGAFDGMFLLIGLLLMKHLFILLGKGFIAISLIITVAICLLWSSIKPIKKHILMLIDDGK